MSSAKKPKYGQKFKDEWLELDDFKSWLSKSNKGESFAFCKICGCDIGVSNGGKFDLAKHKNTSKHMSKQKVVKGQKKIAEVLPSTSKESSLATQIKEAELRLCSYIAEHNIAFAAAEHLPDLLRAVCPDSHIAKGITLGRTKATAIVKNVLGATEKEELCALMRKQSFSIIVDESTDCGTVKSLAISVRIMKNSHVTDAFFDLVTVEDATAIGIHRAIIQSLEKSNIPWQRHLIGYAADGANVMMGAHHSVKELLKKDLPNIFTMKCVCHSFALCASYAGEKIPRFVEDLVRNIYNYIQTSPKRIKEFNMFQSFLELKPHKILHPCQTRWLSLHAAVSRILEQYEALKLYFIDAATNERLTAPGEILEGLNNPFTKLYLQFLNFILPVFNNLNKLMQSEKMQIHHMKKKIEALVRSIMSNYIQLSHLESNNIEDIQYKNPRLFLPLESLYMGAQVTVSLQNLNLRKEDEKQFRVKILDFYIEGVSQIYKRFNFSDPIVQYLEILDPEVVESKKYSSLAPLAARFPSLVPESDLQALDNDWRLLQNTDVKQEKSDSSDPEDYWARLAKKTFCDDAPLFPVLNRFVKDLMCLPHSSATVERIFSQININKTKLRNRLNNTTLCGILHTKRIYSNATCYSHNTQKYLPSFNSTMYQEVEQQ